MSLEEETGVYRNPVDFFYRPRIRLIRNSDNSPGHRKPFMNREVVARSHVTKHLHSWRNPYEIGNSIIWCKLSKSTTRSHQKISTLQISRSCHPVIQSIFLVNTIFCQRWNALANPDSKYFFTIQDFLFINGFYTQSCMPRLDERTIKKATGSTFPETENKVGIGRRSVLLVES